MINECSTWSVSADLSCSDGDGMSQGTPSLRSALIEIHNPSLNREHLAGVCTGKLATSRSPSPPPQPGGDRKATVFALIIRAAGGCADLWTQTSLAVHQRCCWAGTSAASRAETRPWVGCRSHLASQRVAFGSLMRVS